VYARIDDQFQKYIGSFVDGQRSGPGELQLYDDELNTFYTHFRGTWANNRPYKGSYYTPEGIVSARIDEETTDLAQNQSYLQQEASREEVLRLATKSKPDTEQEPAR